MATIGYVERALSRRLSRRRALYGAAGSGMTALALAACGGSNNAKPAATATAAKPTVTAAAATAAGTSAATAIAATPAAAGSPAAAGTTVAANITRGGTWRFPAGALLDIWDPHWNASSYTLTTMLSLVFNKLLKWGSISKGEIQPDLAASWEQISPTMLTYHLRNNVAFHDKPLVNGRALTAEDVKFSVQRQLNANEPRFQRRYQWEVIDKIEIPDQHTVQFTLKSPNAPFISYTAGQWAFIVAREPVEKLGDLNKAEGMVGTGPFMYEEWKSDTHYLMKRNPKYFLPGQPYMDASESLPFADNAAMEAAFRTKKIDDNYLGTWPYPVVEKVRKDIPEILFDTRGNLWFYYIRFNVGRPPFNDVRVRKAISYAVDRKQAIDQAWFGYAKLNGPVPWPLESWALPPDELAKYPGYPSPTPDTLNEAKKLMEAAGYTDSKPLKSDVTNAGGLMGEIYRENLKRIGFEANLVPIPSSAAYLKAQTDKAMNIWWGPDNGYEDPDEYLTGAFHTGSSRNFFDYSNPELDALMDKQRQTLDVATRKSLVLDVQRKLMEEMPNVFNYSTQALYLRWPYVKNRNINEWLNEYQIEEVWLDKNDPSFKGRSG